MNCRIDLLPDRATADIRAAALHRQHPGATISVKEVELFVVNVETPPQSYTWNRVWLVEARF